VSKFEGRGGIFLRNRSVKYSQEFQRLAVAKYLSRGKRPVTEVTRELGISPTYIYKWVNSHCDEDLTMRPVSRSPDSVPAHERAKLVFEYEALAESEKGEFLRREGLTSEALAQWKQAMVESLADQKASDSELKSQVKRLEKELQRKDKALAEAAALLVLQKKCGTSTVRGKSRRPSRALSDCTVDPRSHGSGRPQIGCLSNALPFGAHAAALGESASSL
jgi:transposase-like protein